MKIFTNLNVLKIVKRFKSNFFKFIEVETLTSKEKFLNPGLLEKILNLKDERNKQRMIEIYMKGISENRLKNIPVNYFLKFKKKNMEILSNKLRDKSTVTSLIADQKLVQNYENVSNNKRGEPGKVIWCFLPKEWIDFFVPVTGHSGFFTFMVTFGAYLFSKEIYVCDHEYYNGLSMIICVIYMVKKTGKKLAEYLDKEIDQTEISWQNYRVELKKNVKDDIRSEIRNQECVEEQLVVIQAKRENIHLQREAEFRRRQMEVYESVKRLLDYQVAIEQVKRKIQHKNLIYWVTKEVERSLTDEFKEEYMTLCLADIQKLIRKIEETEGKK